MNTVTISTMTETATTQYTTGVASNVCGDLPGLIPPNLDCSLCLIGFPQAGGMVGVSFYGPICPPISTPSPSYWMGVGTKYAPFKCAWECPSSGEPDANTWVAEATFGGVSSGSCANQYRMRATLNAVSSYQISISVVVEVLVYDGTGWSWSGYASWAELLTEVVNGDTTRYRGRAFTSPNYVPISVAETGGKGDPVSYVKTVVGLQSMRLGCGSKAYALPICGFWNGARWLTCLRGVIVSTSNTARRQFFQLGFDIGGCGAVGGTYCGCDRFVLSSTSPPSGTAEQNADPQFITDYGVLGIPGGGEGVGVVQQIQIGIGNSTGVQVAVKQLGGSGLWVCTNDNGGGWVCSAPTVSQSNSPHILTVNRSGFDVHLYAMVFPNDNILAEGCGNGGDYPTPDPNDPWWCTPDGCVQSFLQPADAIAGPFPTSTQCGTACSSEPTTFPVWCVGSECVISETPPAGYTAGPFTNLGDCNGSGCATGWYCRDTGSGPTFCAFYTYRPGGVVSGPYATQAECEAACGSGFMTPNPTLDRLPVAQTQAMPVQQRKELLKRAKLLQVSPCRNLGEPLEEMPSCGCAGGRLHKCSVYGTCRTKGNPIDGVPSCWECPDYATR